MLIEYTAKDGGLDDLAEEDMENQTWEGGRTVLQPDMALTISYVGEYRTIVLRRICPMYM
jgi:hypothetical protein